jgi:von Willebrand factor type A domain
MKKGLWFLMIVLIPLCVQAAPFPEAVFILDASGSMLGSAGTETKMAAAKSVLRQVVPEVAPEVKIGLVAYGHRQKDDCTDIEILIPPGSDDRTAMLSVIEAMEPKGMTPISESILQVAEVLDGRDAETTVILVSDGKETCEGDPCEAVRALKASGVRFIMHVVGFDVTEEDKAQLSCIAQAGGGQYFGASDADALLAALQAVCKEMEEKVEKAKTQLVQKASGLGKVRIVFPENALKSLAGFKIIRKSDGKVLKETEFTSDDSTHPLMSGDYSLVLQFANANYKPPTEMPVGDFTVVKGEVAQIKLGSLLFNIADELTKAPVEAIVVTISGSGEAVLRAEPLGNDYYLYKPKALLPGTYDVAFQYPRDPTPLPVALGVEISAETVTPLTLDSGLQLVRPDGTKVTGWNLLPAGGSTPILSVTRRWDNEEPLWRPFVVPPGTYDLHVLIDGMDEALPVGDGIVILSGQTVKFETGL